MSLYMCINIYIYIQYTHIAQKACTAMWYAWNRLHLLGNLCNLAAREVAVSTKPYKTHMFFQIHPSVIEFVQHSQQFQTCLGNTQHSTETPLDLFCRSHCASTASRKTEITSWPGNGGLEGGRSGINSPRLARWALQELLSSLGHEAITLFRLRVASWHHTQALAVCARRRCVPEKDLALCVHLFVHVECFLWC